MTAFVNDHLPQLGCNLQYYSVAGASKRGWTTWLVGAVDPNRVKAIIPMVLDAINFVAVEHHEYRSYGGWGYALAVRKKSTCNLFIILGLPRNEHHPPLRRP
jgi:PhoPQ-activated pathogenicity-related protein